MSYWLYETPGGPFSIVERTSKGVDAYFCASHIGHFSNPAEAAMAIASGSYVMPRVMADKELPSDVPPAISEWSLVAGVKAG